MIISLLEWWYGAGWLLQFRRVEALLGRVADFFSFSLLITTLFSPFRQISAGQNTTRASLDTQLRALADKLISRMIGGMVRTATLIFGLLVLLLVVLFSIVWVISWLLVPLAPLGVLIWEVFG